MTFIESNQRLFFKIEKHNPLHSVLVVMKDYQELKKVCAWLKLENFHIITARNGKDAIERYRKEPTSFVISDWDLPQLNGVRLFQQIRNNENEISPYLILTSNNLLEKDLSAASFAGADEFIPKPLNHQILHARMHSGLRILKLQKNLLEKNQELNEANAYLSQAYQRLDDDLKAAGILQNAQRPPNYVLAKTHEIATAIQSCSHIGGDVIGHFPLDENTIGIYAIDVMGHSVSSALLGIMLEQSLNPYDKTSNPAFERMSDNNFRIREPHELLEFYNHHHQSEENSGFFFTMSYAQINHQTGWVKLSLAGQPEAAIIRRNGNIEYHGTGSTPIGILEESSYKTDCFQLTKGDAIMLYSDGIIEACDREQSTCDKIIFSDFLEKYFPKNLSDFSSLMPKNLKKYSGKNRFHDDISAIVMRAM